MAKTLTRWSVVVTAATLAACASLPRREPDATDLRVMTWNIQAGGHGIDSIAAVIRAQNPDIIGLQEVDVHWSERSAFADEANELGSRLRMHVLFAPIYSIQSAESARPRREFGVAILTRYRVIDWRNDTLTRLSTQVANPVPMPAPGLLEARLDVGGRVIGVYTTHLDYRADPSVRRTQVAEMVAYLARNGGPSIMVGDMNATPDAAELAPLFGALRDAWSASMDEGLTYPSDRPVKRIDYVLISRDFTVLDAAVITSTASDHRPVITRLRIR